MGRDNDQDTRERNGKLVRNFIERMLNDPGALEEFLRPDFIDHNATPDQPQGREGVKRILEKVLSALGGLRVKLEDVIAEGDRVVVRHRAEAVHVGNFMGFPGTGKTLRWTGISIYRIEDGKIAERWGLIDHAALIQQLREVSAASDF
jgi:steroid delta-isomerase-like uncharacterized protein